jgi:UDP-2,3-diacylglucosamine pyrophosphatase LpxH
VILLPTNTLLHDFEERLRALAADLGVPARIVAYTSAASSDGRRRFRSQAQESDVVLLTPDMWHASLVRNWELGEQGHAANREWARRLVATDLVVMEEFDVLRDNCLAALRLLLPVVRKVAVGLRGSPPQIILTSATATNPHEVRDSLLPGGEIVQGRGRHGRLHILAVSRFQRKPHGWHDALHTVLRSCLQPNPETGIGYRILIIIDNRRLAEETFHQLRLAEQGFAIVHGSLDMSRNRAVVERFKRGDLRGLVSTTIINRGIDIGDLTLLVLVGIPVGGLRDVIQSFGRIARRPEAVGVIYHLLDRRRPLEEAFARDGKRLEALYHGTTAPVFVPLDRRHALKRAVLTALTLGCRARHELPGLFPQEMWRWLPGMVVSLRGQGLLQYTPTELTPTARVGEELHKLPLRGGRRRFAVRLAETEESLGQLDVEQVARSGLPEDHLLLGGHCYRVTTTSPSQVVVTRAKSAQGEPVVVSDNWVDSNLSLAVRGVSHFGGYTFQLVDVYPELTPTKRVLRNLETQAVTEEAPVRPEDQVHLSLDPLEGFTIQTESEGGLTAQTLAYAMLAAAYVETPTDVQVMTTGNRVVVADRPGAIGGARALYQGLPQLLPEVAARITDCVCHQAGCPACIYLASPPSWWTDRTTIERTLHLLEQPVERLDGSLTNHTSLPRSSEASRDMKSNRIAVDPPSNGLFSTSDGRREVEVIFADLHVGDIDSHWREATHCLAQLLKKYRVFAVYFAGDTVELRYAHEAASAKHGQGTTAELALGYQVVESEFDQFVGELQQLGVEKRCVLVTGNHDTHLELIPRAHALVIQETACLPLPGLDIYVLHGHGLGLERAVRQFGRGGAALRAVRQQLEEQPPPLVPRLSPTDWLVIGHYGVGVCDSLMRVVGLTEWKGNLRNPLKASYAVVEPAHTEAPVRLGRWGSRLV